MNYEVTMIERRNKHIYVLKLPDGTTTELASVTHILGKTWPKPALVKWAWRQGVEGSFKVMSDGGASSNWDLERLVVDAGFGVDYKKNAGATRGTAIHEVADKLMKSLDVKGIKAGIRKLPTAYQGYARGLVHWFEDNVDDIDVVESEMAVASATHQYGGTLDILLKRDGKLILGDWKTGKGFYDDMFVQCFAYAGAYTEQTNVTIDEVLIVRLTPEGGYAEQSTTPKPDIFPYLCKVFHSMGNIKD